MPFFSIIIPLYNKEKFIENTLKSVLNQTFTDYEILIVNDGSTDSSHEKVQQFKDSRIRYFSKENGGVSTARNYGIKEAKSDFIAFIDADDYWYPDFLKEMYQTINLFPNQKVFSAATEIETSRKIIKAQYSIQRTGRYKIVNFFDASHREPVLWTSSVVINITVFEDVGRFDDELKIAEDTDLWIRIGLKYSIVFIWKILTRYCYDKNSISRDTNYFLQKRTYLKHYEEEKINIALKKYLDLNRFSEAIKHKITNNEVEFKSTKSNIDLKLIIFRKRLLLTFPGIILKSLIFIKNRLADIGLSKSIFK